MNKLSDTAKLMISENYEDRFIAEHMQLSIRLEKLRETIVKYKAGTLQFPLACPIEILEQQASAMQTYLTMLEIRAEIEGLYTYSVKNK